MTAVCLLGTTLIVDPRAQLSVTTAMSPSLTRTKTRMTKRLEKRIEILEKSRDCYEAAYIKAERGRKLWKMAAEWLEQQQAMPDPGVDRILDMARDLDNECDVPPIGWRCTREKGHEGPCAALPMKGYEEILEEALKLSNEDKLWLIDKLLEDTGDG